MMMMYESYSPMRAFDAESCSQKSFSYSFAQQSAVSPISLRVVSRVISHVIAHVSIIIPIIF